MHSTAGIVLNFDIWLEIIRQYRFNMLDDGGTSKAKRAALRSLALVSRRLALLAQSEMWRTVCGIRHVSEYIKDMEGPNLIRNVSPNILRQPLQPQVAERMQKMLSCTQQVVLDGSAKITFSDWEFVQMATGQSHLFKNLEYVDIDWDECRNCENGRMILPLLASPRLRGITHRNVAHEDEAILLLFHSILRVHDAPISSIRLLEGGRLSPGIISRMLRSTSPNVFVDIRAVRLSHQDRFAAWYLALASCANLTSLRIREGPVTPTFWDYPKKKLIRLENLRRLEITGQSQHIFLLRQLDCPMLDSLTLYLCQSFLGCSDIFSSISHFVQLKMVHITIGKAQIRDPLFLQLEDLRPVLSPLSTLCYLVVIGVASLLTENDISEIFTMKPSLLSLSISGPSSYTLHPSILSSIAQHKLHSICLPINFSSIMSLTIPPLGASDSPLILLYVPKCAKLPESKLEKLHLVEFIYHMFPKAKIAPLRENETSKAVKDLEIMRAHFCKVSKAASS